MRRKLRPRARRMSPAWSCLGPVQGRIGESRRIGTSVVGVGAPAPRRRVVVAISTAAALVAFTAFPALSRAAVGDITTVAGTGTVGFSGDGGPATSAELNDPYGVAVDGSGNLYIADTQNNRVRKVDGSGTITTVAGTGTAGFSGDGGPATSAAALRSPGVAVDGSGNLYIADYANSRVRKVDGSGTITTVAGTGTAGFSGDGGPATSAELDHPVGVAVDGSGNLYIADYDNNVVRKVNGSGTITTIAGTGTFGFSGDGGPATSAELSSTAGVALDGSGNLYIADEDNSRVRKVDGSGTITTVAGTGTAGFSGDGGPATSAELNFPGGVAVDGSGNLYIADAINHRVRKVDGSGTITTVAGTGTFGFSGDGGPATSAELNDPDGVAVDGSGNLYIADFDNSRVRKVDVDAASFTVNITDDHNDGACTAADCTLREAINRANSVAGTDTINFDIPGSGVHTIQPASALPTISDPVMIDGTSQPGFTGTPLIRLDGASAGADVSGFGITAGSSTVRGIEVTGWDRAGIELDTGGGNLIAGNYIGTNAAGSGGLGNDIGVLIVDGSSNNTVGGTTAGARNLISGNGYGVYHGEQRHRRQPGRGQLHRHQRRRQRRGWPTPSVS